MAGPTTNHLGTSPGSTRFVLAGHDGGRAMSETDLWVADPALDLVLEREIDVPVELVWAAWTQPEHIEKWFTPAPWTTSDVEVDLRPGGRFNSVMHGPAGERSENKGCLLEVIPN